MGNDQLREAYDANASVVTPHPRAHALLARKSNLALLSDGPALRAMGVPSDRAAVLAETIPETRVLTPDNADALWSHRKQYYFKPIDGFGSRATYAGRKLTRRTWESLLEGHYVAQRLVEPSRRKMREGDSPDSLKVDIRHYTYEGETQLIAARLYRGQTTNFRTAGGGFAPVLVPFGDGA